MSRSPVLLAASLLLSTSLHAATRFPGAERKLTAPRASVAGGVQVVTSAAASEGEVIVTWANRERSYASRVSDGAIAARQLPVPAPFVTVIGGESIAVWKELDRVMSGRLTVTGVGEPRVVLAGVPNNESIVDVIDNESHIAVVLRNTGFDKTRILLLDASGNAARTVIDLGPWLRAVAVGADPGGFLAFDLVLSELRGRRITLDGVVAEFRIPTAGEPFGLVATAFDGAKYLVVLTDGPYSPTVRGTIGMLVSPDGAQRSETFPILGEFERFDAIAGHDGGSLVFFDDLSPGGNFQGGVVSLDHARRARTTVPGIAPARIVRSVTDGNTALALWHVYTGEQHVYGRWIDLESGMPLSNPFVVSVGTKEELQPAVALGQDLDLVVWEEVELSGLHTIVAARVAHDGTVLDAAPLRLSLPDVDSNVPAVAFNGRHFVVVWCEQIDAVNNIGRLLARRVSQDGVIVDTEPLVLSEERSNRPAIAHSGDTTLVVWEGRGIRPSPHGPGTEIFGKRLTQSGFLVDSTPLLISRDEWHHYQPDIAAGDGQFLVGWQTYKWYGAHSPVFTASSVALVSTGGTITEPIVLRPLSDHEYANRPEVAWNGSEFLAAWTVARTSYATRISSSGAIVSSPATVLLPSIADAAYFDGSWHLISGVSAAYSPFPVIGGDIRGVYLSRDLRHEGVVSPATSAEDEVEPMLASNGTRAVIVYRRMLGGSPHHGSSAIMYRPYDQLPKLRRRAVH